MNVAPECGLAPPPLVQARLSTQAVPPIVEERSLSEVGSDDQWCVARRSILDVVLVPSSAILLHKMARE
jgi:hypothetical protein